LRSKEKTVAKSKGRRSASTPQKEVEATPDQLDFDQYLGKPVTILEFVWPNGEVRPFEGFCRGNWTLDILKKYQRSIGVCTGADREFAFIIDTRVRCALPQFWIDEKPFHFPIVSFLARAAWVDEQTGDFKDTSRPKRGPAPDPDSSADKPASAKTPAEKEAGSSPSGDDPE
jgi:hypothetical protein